ncbi:alpha/beta hydrolase [Streptomyces sp. BSE7-9]|uniref:alpha/beta hydrolase n=1 Tax=Streptomyces sp. BSE7-9 TaxID=2759948 RepID=UPI0018EE9CBE|nr:alpha/beta hydrolase [Streptomyces sp. BSE7-9]MBJ6646096.1 alpha/beta hydrolase [Streptomyces sp. BSE7-9]
MKPRLVFVHGVGGVRDPAAELDGWLRALAKGARAAGHAVRVPRLVRGGVTDVRFAYYGDLFLTPGAQTGGDTREVLADGVQVLLREAVDERLPERTEGDQDARVLRHAQAQLDPQGDVQGAGSVVRQVLSAANTLLAVPGLRTFGRWASSRMMVGQLDQVARYLARGEADGAGRTLDARVCRRVAEELDPAVPTVVVAHSLGTVVALEALSDYPGEVPLLLTLGSPLGLRTAVAWRTRPQPPRVPDAVASWVNVWDRDDLIVGRPELEKFFGPNERGVLPDTRRVDSDGAWVHPALKYLAHPGAAGPVIEAVEVLTQP